MSTEPHTERPSRPLAGVIRRSLALHLVLVLGSLALAAGAAAAPLATFKAYAIPIPGFPRTGNILGAPAEIETRVTIGGSEYGGFPSPLVGLSLYAPAGFKVNPTGFSTCATSVLEATGPSGCPKGSPAGPIGEGLGVVTFGGERVNESVTIQPFFAPTGGLTFYAVGKTPSLFEIIEPGHWIKAPPPYGPEAIVDVPLVETVPGGYDASILSFIVTVGAAHKKHGHTISYFTLPKHCPTSGAPIKAELRFLSGETTTITYRQPCPRAR